MLCMLGVVKYDMSGVCMCISLINMNTVHFILNVENLKYLDKVFPKDICAVWNFSDLFFSFIFNEHCC